MTTNYETMSFDTLSKVRISERNAKKTRFISIAEWKYLRPQVKVTIKRAESKILFGFSCFAISHRYLPFRGRLI